MKTVTAFVIDNSTDTVVSEMHGVPLHTAIEGLWNELGMWPKPWLGLSRETYNFGWVGAMEARERLMLHGRRWHLRLSVDSTPWDSAG